MPEVLIQFNPAQLAAIQGRLAGIKNGVPQALAGAINDTAKQERTQISKKIRERFNVKKRDLDKRISITKATQRKISGGIHIEKSKRLGLQYFGAKQVGSTKRATVKRVATKLGTSQLKTRGGGVMAAIEKGKRRLYLGAFMGPYPGALAVKLHGGVFQRDGKSRLPIHKLFGLSPWGMFLRGGMLPPSVKETETLLYKNVFDRVRWLMLQVKTDSQNISIKPGAI